MSSELIQPNVPVKFSARNPYPAYRKLRGGGDCYKLTVEVEEEVWNKLKLMPIGAIVECVMWFHDGDSPDALDVREAEEKAAKPKKEKGPYSDYWGYLFRTPQIQYSRDLWEVLGIEDSRQVQARLHECLGVESLTTVSPAQFENWLSGYDLQALINQSRQAAAKVGL